MLADAEGGLGQLAGVGRLRDALSSTRIEGTQATMAGPARLDELPLSTRFSARCSGRELEPGKLLHEGRRLGEPGEHRRQVEVAGQNVERKRLVARGQARVLAVHSGDLLARELVSGDLDAPGGDATRVQEGRGRDGADILAGDWDAIARRQARLYLDGLTVTGAPPLPGQPPTRADLEAAFARAAPGAHER